MALIHHLMSKNISYAFVLVEGNENMFFIERVFVEVLFISP